jgi:hypothetical protein
VELRRQVEQQDRQARTVRHGPMVADPADETCALVVLSG